MNCSLACPDEDACQCPLAAPDEWKPTRWWRVLYVDGRRHGPGTYEGRRMIWCETSDEDEARTARATCPSGGILQRLYERTRDQWRDVEE